MAWIPKENSHTILTSPHTYSGLLQQLLLEYTVYNSAFEDSCSQTVCRKMFQFLLQLISPSCHFLNCMNTQSAIYNGEHLLPFPFNSSSSFFFCCTANCSSVSLYIHVYTYVKSSTRVYGRKRSIRGLIMHAT